MYKKLKWEENYQKNIESGLFMEKMSSYLTGRHVKFVDCQQCLKTLKFVDGGGWEYDHGFFDRVLDEQHTLFLRLPFRVEIGRLDVEETLQDTVIVFDEPFVLLHLYQEGNDDTAKARIVAAPFDQFQAPIDRDAPLQREQIESARDALVETERALNKFFNLT